MSRPQSGTAAPTASLTAPSSGPTMGLGRQPRTAGAAAPLRPGARAPALASTSAGATKGGADQPPPEPTALDHESA